MMALYSVLGGTATPAESVITALSTAFQTIAGNISSVLTTVAPIALTIVGAGMVLTFGIKWFKRLTNKA